jgi:hypothetical protein
MDFPVKFETANARSESTVTLEIGFDISMNSKVSCIVWKIDPHERIAVDICRLAVKLAIHGRSLRGKRSLALTPWSSGNGRSSQIAPMNQSVRIMSLSVWRGFYYFFFGK